MTNSLLRVETGPLVAGGSALVRRENDKVIFVDGALPDEVVDVEITREHRQMLEAKVVTVVEASADRVESECALFHEGCGGCQWNFIASEAQGLLKTSIVNESMKRIAKREDVQAAFAGAVSANGYRTTMSMATRDGRPGMRHRDSHDVLPPIPCVITHPLLHPLITNGHYDQPEVQLRASVSNNTAVFGNQSIVEHVHDQDFVVSAGSFFQSGPEAIELLADTIDQLVPADARWIVDAYAGVGVLGALLTARRGNRLTAIESNKTAISDARSNLSAFDADVVHAQVAEVELFDDVAPDVVLADPSRTGLGKSASASLARLRSPKLILVSCDPASLARDASLLNELGYDLESIKVLDLFPQTPHVEAVSVFNLR